MRCTRTAPEDPWHDRARAYDAACSRGPRLATLSDRSRGQVASMRGGRRVSANLLRLLRAGMLVLVLGFAPVSDAKGEVGASGDVAQGVSEPVEQRPPGAETHHAHNALNASSIRLGVSLGALLFAALWFAVFRGAPLRVFPGLVVALYVGLAFGIGADVYPVSRFDMYAQTTPRHHQDPARLVVQDGKGELHTVQRYARWRCDGPIEPLLDGCFERLGPFYHLPYIDQEDLSHVDRAGPPTQDIEQVALVRAVWRLSGTQGGVQRVDICPLVTCQAAVVP